MSSKLIISCEDSEAKVMALIDRSVLDHIPTDQKYNKDMEEILYSEYGYGFLSPEDENKFFSIPSYIKNEDITLWEAEKIMYEANFAETYPEIKEYKLKK